MQVQNHTLSRTICYLTSDSYLALRLLDPPATPRHSCSNVSIYWHHPEDCSNTDCWARTPDVWSVHLRRGPKIGLSSKFLDDATIALGATLWAPLSYRYLEFRIFQIIITLSTPSASHSCFWHFFCCTVDPWAMWEVGVSTLCSDENSYLTFDFPKS